MPRRTPRRAPQGDGQVATRKRPPRNGEGHPPVVSDPARVRRMLDALMAGVPITAACEHAGIHPASHHRAMDNGKQAEEHAHAHGDNTLTDRQRQYREYRDSVLRARAATAVVHVSLINKAARGGELVKETTRRYRNDDGEMVSETEREYTRPDWRASKFLVQHSAYREEFADRSTRAVELTGADGGPVSFAPAEEMVTGLAERLRVVAERQAKQLPGGWDPPEDQDPDVTDAELVDDEGER